MVEPGITLQLNDGTEGTPSWSDIDTALRWTGPAGIADPFPAPIGDGDDAFFDTSSAPNDGECWHDTGSTDDQITVAGRNANDNVLQALEDGTDATADPPELSAYDDATDAGNRAAPAIWVLAGTTGSSSISCIRAIETTVSSPDSLWINQVHDSSPSGDGEALAGNGAGDKVVCASVLSSSGTKQFNIAACAPHDSTAGQTTFVYCFQYTYT